MKKKAGGFVDDGTTVYFTTNSGELSASSSNTVDGVATVELTLDNNMEAGTDAEVNAFTINSESQEVNVSCIVGLITEEIALSANPESNVPGGVSTITAIVTKKAGGFVVDGTTVYFTTNSGTLSAASATTVNGVATVELILDDNMQAGTDAEVNAFTLNSGDPEEKIVKCIDIIITIYADDYSIAPNGTSNITAVVTNSDGTPVKGVIVIFFAKNDVGDDIGTLNPVHCLTNINGIATTTLTLDTDGDIATVTAKCGSRVSNKITITSSTGTPSGFVTTSVIVVFPD